MTYAKDTTVSTDRRSAVAHAGGAAVMTPSLYLLAVEALRSVRDDLVAIKGTFEGYAYNHEAKGTHEGRAKAETNRRHARGVQATADRAATTLSRLEGVLGGEKEMLSLPKPPDGWVWELTPKRPEHGDDWQANASTPSQAPPRETWPTDEQVEAVWQDLLDKDDRTSPEEYPEMCLITREEVAALLAASPAK